MARGHITLPLDAARDALIALQRQLAVALAADNAQLAARVAGLSPTLRNPASPNGASALPPKWSASMHLVPAS